MAARAACYYVHSRCTPSLLPLLHTSLADLCPPSMHRCPTLHSYWSVRGSGVPAACTQIVGVYSGSGFLSDVPQKKIGMIRHMHRWLCEADLIHEDPSTCSGGPPRMNEASNVINSTKSTQGSPTGSVSATGTAPQAGTTVVRSVHHRKRHAPHGPIRPASPVTLSPHAHHPKRPRVHDHTRFRPEAADTSGSSEHNIHGMH